MSTSSHISEKQRISRAGLYRLAVVYAGLILLALGYLAMFDSMFIAYAQRNRNPMTAAAPGWVILGERIARWTALGAALVLQGITGVFRRRKEKR